MLYQWIRLIKSDNGVLTDISLDNQNESKTCLLNLTTGEDYIYIGQQYPFNNFYYKSAVANDVSAVLSIEYWDGSFWKAAVDVLDATSANGASLANSGAVQFTPNYHYRWARVYDTSETFAPAELQSLTIYNLYWIRLKWSATLKATTASKKFTYAFSTHQQINHRDSTIGPYLPSFNLTSWEDPIITASMDVVLDLKRKNLIIHEGQILRFDDVTNATNWRTLINIYRDLGGDYKDKHDAASKEYYRSIDMKGFTFDKNENAFVETDEVENSCSRLIRE
jgi:hypothetical protein